MADSPDRAWNRPNRTQIFINYRWDDADTYATELAARLRQEVSEAAIFLDTRTTEFAEPYPDVIREHMLSSTHALILIGPDWISATDSQGRRRLDQPDDWVRREVALALRAGVRVLPVYLRGAEPPAASELPEELQPLLERRAFFVRRDLRDEDLDELVRLVTQSHRSRRRRRFVVATVLAAAAGLVLGLAGHWGVQRSGAAQELVAVGAAPYSLATVASCVMPHLRELHLVSKDLGEGLLYIQRTPNTPNGAKAQSRSLNRVVCEYNESVGWFRSRRDKLRAVQQAAGPVLGPSVESALDLALQSETRSDDMLLELMRKEAVPEALEATFRELKDHWSSPVFTGLIADGQAVELANEAVHESLEPAGRRVAIELRLQAAATEAK